MPGTGGPETYPGRVTDKETGGEPDTGSSPYDDPTLSMRRDRPSMLESDDDLGFDNSTLDGSGPVYDGAAYGGAAYAAPTEQIYRPINRVQPWSPHRSPKPAAGLSTWGFWYFGSLSVES